MSQVQTGPSKNDEEVFWRHALTGSLSSLKRLGQRFPSLVDCVDYRGSSPLHVASFEGHLDVVQYLLELQANVNCADCSGATPLLPAAFEGHLSVAQCLLEHQATVHCVDNHGWTPLHAAAGFCCRIPLVKLLVQYGAVTNCRLQWSMKHSPADFRGTLDLLHHCTRM